MTKKGRIKYHILSTNLLSVSYGTRSEKGGRENWISYFSSRKSLRQDSISLYRIYDKNTVTKAIFIRRQIIFLLQDLWL